jgi:hypothetical protein
VTLFLPGAVVQQPARWSSRPATGFIYSWVRTDHPGYRRLSVGGVPFILPSGTYRFDELITAIDAAMPGTCTMASNGRVSFATAGLGFPDRLGWLLGFGREGGTSEVTALHDAPFVAPGCIPLQSITWERVTVEREREIVTDRSRRQGGYVFGAARLWIWTVGMTRHAFDALSTGWCLRSKVTVAGASLTAISSAVPGGALTGHVLGLDGSPTWDGPTNDTCRARIVIAASA